MAAQGYDILVEEKEDDISPEEANEGREASTSQLDTEITSKTNDCDTATCKPTSTPYLSEYVEDNSQNKSFQAISNGDEPPSIELRYLS